MNLARIRRSVTWTDPFEEPSLGHVAMRSMFVLAMLYCIVFELTWVVFKFVTRPVAWVVR